MKNLLTRLLCISILITTFVFAEEQQQELNIPVYVTIKGNNVTLQNQILSITKKELRKLDNVTVVSGDDDDYRFCLNIEVASLLERTKGVDCVLSIIHTEKLDCNDTSIEKLIGNYMKTGNENNIEYECKLISALFDQNIIDAQRRQFRDAVKSLGW